MTLFQARFIQWLTLIGCSLRATAGNYHARYKQDGSYGKLKDYDAWGGSQLDGIFLREEAIALLIGYGIDPVIEVYDNKIGYDNDSYSAWRKKIKGK